MCTSGIVNENGVGARRTEFHGAPLFVAQGTVPMLLRAGEAAFPFAVFAVAHLPGRDQRSPATIGRLIWQDRPKKKIRHGQNARAVFWHPQQESNL